MKLPSGANCTAAIVRSVGSVILTVLPVAIWRIEIACRPPSLVTKARIFRRD